MILYCDGSSTNHAGPKSLAKWAVAASNGKQLLIRGSFGTNHVAEYKALICALYIALCRAGVKEDVTIRLDSELIYKQMEGTYKVKSRRLASLYAIAKKLVGGIERTAGRVVLELVPSEENRAHVTIGPEHGKPSVFEGITDIVNEVRVWKE